MHLTLENVNDNFITGTSDVFSGMRKCTKRPITYHNNNMCKTGLDKFNINIVRLLRRNSEQPKPTQ
jgi:hypothetical protein